MRTSARNNASRFSLAMPCPGPLTSMRPKSDANAEDKEYAYSTTVIRALVVRMFGQYDQSITAFCNPLSPTAQYAHVYLRA
jgi:hypothetical protein